MIKRLFKFLIFIVGLLIVTSAAALFIDSQRTQYLTIDKSKKSAADSYLITHVNIIPMNQDTVLKNKTVYIKQGVIDQITDSLMVKGVEVINAKNKFLSPGLIDMHIHLWDRYELGLYLSNGVTTVRNLWGMPMHLRIKKDVENNLIYSPSFFTTGPKLTGVTFIGSDNLNLRSKKEAKEKVISIKKSGYDFIKTYYGLDRELFDAVIEQAKISKLDIVAHPSQKVPFSYHLNSSIKSIEHVEEIVQQPLQFDLDTLKLQPIIDSIADYKSVSYCPTLTVFNNIYQMLSDDAILDSKALEYMNPLIRKVDSKKQFKRWFDAKQKDSSVVSRIKNQHDFHLRIVQKLHQAGVNLICGTDGGIGVTLPGFSIHKELLFYKQAGLSNYEVLKTATLNASKTHAVVNSLGSVEVGKIANLLLLEKNPLEDLSVLKNPNTVFIKGRKLNRKTLDLFKAKAKDRKNLTTTAVRYLEAQIFN